MGTTWVPGSELSRGFYREVIRPLLGTVPHSAGLLGWGSDVLGYDTERSTDHGWGPRLLVFVDGGTDCGRLAAALDAGLPETYAGWPVRFGWDRVPVRHWVTVTTLSRWLQEQLGGRAGGNVHSRLAGDAAAAVAGCRLRRGVCR
jgi:hypothetical protein